MQILDKCPLRILLCIKMLLKPQNIYSGANPDFWLIEIKIS